MAQHFLLCAQARTLSLREVFSLTDDQAFEWFRQSRWGNAEEVACPQCGVVERHWFLPSRTQWCCKACNHTFSVTSGTIFAYHKLPLRLYLAAALLYSNAAKGISALQIGRDLDVQYKTAFVLLHKIRFVMRQSSSSIERHNGCHGGANRTLSFVITRENQADIGALAQPFVTEGTSLRADQSNAYDLLHAYYPVQRVNHDREYRADDGTTNNQCLVTINLTG